MNDINIRQVNRHDVDGCYRTESICYTSDGATREKILLICKSELVLYYQNYSFIYGGKSKSKHGGFEWHEMYLLLNAVNEI